MIELKKIVSKKIIETFSQGEYGVVCYQGHLCVLNFDELRHPIFSKAHSSWYPIHPAATKIYRNLWEVTWWDEMNKNIVEFMARCPNFQEVKDEHKKWEVQIKTSEFLLGSGRIWILHSLWVYLVLVDSMILFGLVLIEWQSLLIFIPWRPYFHLNKMLGSIFGKWLSCTEFLYPLFLNESLSYFKILEVISERSWYLRET